MRWLGMAKRALGIAGEYISVREAFGSKLVEHESVQWMLGEAAMAIETGRMLTMHAAWRIDQGHRAWRDVSMAKVAVPDVAQRVADRAMQIFGAMGGSDDTPIHHAYAMARLLRIADGPDEVHLRQVFRQEPAARWTVADSPYIARLEG